jgi:predicted HTH domain antitoxin
MVCDLFCNFNVMKSLHVDVEITEDLLSVFKVTRENAGKELKKLAAVALYQMRKISIGRAAAIAGMNRGEFEDYLAEHGVPISNITPQQLNEDIAFLKGKK